MSEKQPYQFIQNNSEVKMKANNRGQLTVTEKQRDLKLIERSMINDTEELVSIFDGTVTTSSHLFTGERESNTPFESAIYLDKSARPVRKLVHGLWRELSDSTEPQAYFINIDKRPWLAEMGFVDGMNGVNLEDIPANEVSIDKIDPDYLRHALTRIRALYVDSLELIALAEQEDENIDEEQKDIERVWSLPTRIDGQTVAIVDEVKSSGNTLRIALQLMQAAIPEAHFEGVWWSDPGQVSWDIGDQNMQKAAKYVPAWYDAESLDGRGVGDINERKSSVSPSKAQRVGRQVLSAPLFDTSTGKYIGPGRRTFMINHDIQTLVKRFKNRELIDYLPELSLSDERENDFNGRLLRYYQATSVQSALAERENNKKQ